MLLAASKVESGDEVNKIVPETLDAPVEIDISPETDSESEVAIFTLGAEKLELSDTRIKLLNPETEDLMLLKEMESLENNKMESSPEKTTDPPFVPLDIEREPSPASRETSDPPTNDKDPPTKPDPPEIVVEPPTPVLLSPDDTDTEPPTEEALVPTDILTDEPDPDDSCKDPELLPTDTEPLSPTDDTRTDEPASTCTTDDDSTSTDEPDTITDPP